MSLDRRTGALLRFTMPFNVTGQPAISLPLHWNSDGLPVGVQLVEGNHGWSAHVLEYFSVGTAVIPTSDTHEIPPPTLTLSLNDSRQDRLTGF